MLKSSPSHLQTPPEALFEVARLDPGRLIAGGPGQGSSLDFSGLTPRAVGLLDRLKARILLPEVTGGDACNFQLLICLPDRLNAIRTLIRSTEPAPDTKEER